jgi:hypothetical protein
VSPVDAGLNVLPRVLSEQPWEDLDFGGRPAEQLTLEEQTDRMMANLTAFIAKVTA